MVRLFTCFMLGLLCLTAAQGQTVPLSSSQMRIVLDGPEVAIFRDASGEREVGDLNESLFAGSFYSTRVNAVQGYTKDALWLRITLQRLAQAPENWILEVTNPFINDLRFYERVGDSFMVSQAGDRFAFSQRKVPFHNPAFAVHLPDTEPRTFYLRLASDSTLSAQLFLWQPEAFSSQGQKELIILGIVLGMILMSLLISTVHWVNSRDEALLRFAGMTMMMFFFLPSQLGLWAQFLFPNNPLIADAAVPWQLAMVIAIIHFAFAKPLDIARSYPRIHRALKFTSLSTFLFPLTREVDLYAVVGGPGLQLLFVGTLLTLGAIAWQRWRQNIEGSMFLFMGLLSLTISVLAVRLIYVGFLPANALMSFGWMPGLLAFLVLVHIGVVIDFRAGWRERNAAKNETLLATTIARNEQRLREEQTAFFTFVAHELRTPLGVMVMGLNNLDRDLHGASDVTVQRIKRLGRAAERMGHLIERNLTLQRINHTDFSPQPGSFKPIELAQSVLHQVRDAYPQHTFEFTPFINPELVADVDPELIELSLNNLLLSSPKYRRQMVF